jgi:hypothetical protein
MRFFKFFRNFATSQKQNHRFGAHAMRGEAHPLDQASVTGSVRDWSMRIPGQRAGTMDFPAKSMFEIEKHAMHP